MHISWKKNLASNCYTILKLVSNLYYILTLYLYAVLLRIFFCRKIYLFTWQIIGHSIQFLRAAAGAKEGEASSWRQWTRMTLSDSLASSTTTKKKKSYF